MTDHGRFLLQNCSSVATLQPMMESQAAFHVGPGWAPVGPQLGPSWAPDGPDWGPFGNAAWDVIIFSCNSIAAMKYRCILPEILMYMILNAHGYAENRLKMGQ